VLCWLDVARIQNKGEGNPFQPRDQEINIWNWVKGRTVRSKMSELRNKDTEKNGFVVRDGMFIGALC